MGGKVGNSPKERPGGYFSGPKMMMGQERMATREASGGVIIRFFFIFVLLGFFFLPDGVGSSEAMNEWELKQRQ